MNDIPGALPPCHDWHPEDVKAAIRKTGVTLKALSIQNGYSASVIRRTLKIPYPAAQAIIARHLGVAPQDIWPSRYDETGTPLKGRLANRHKSSRSAGSPHCQKRGME
jgi:Ner family transcriptional regulator